MAGEKRGEVKYKSNPYPCKRCNVLPIRKQDGFETWLECPNCGDKGLSCNVVSDNWAYYNSEGRWNRHVLHWQPLPDPPALPSSKKEQQD